MRPCSILVLTLILACPASLPAADEPADLVRLRDQYQKRLESQTEPLRKLYLDELGKLERRLAQQGKLEEALVVKQERENLEALRRQPGELAKAATKEDLAKALANTTWSYVGDVPDKPDETYYVILFDDGRAYFSWDHSTGTWKAIATNRIELKGAANARSEMKVSPDLSSWEGTFSLDAFRRFGKRVGAPAAR